MAQSGPILPVIRLPINYHEEKEQIKEFLTTFKGPVPSLRQHRTAILQLDDDDDGDEGVDDDEFLDDLDDMDIGTSSSSSRRSGKKSSKPSSGLKYMEQLQRIANREQDSLVFDLNDLTKVGRGA